MINKISALLSEEIRLKLNSSDNEKEIYTYAIEVLMSLFINFIILFFTACILGKIVELITFIVFFSGLRSFAGGYHAKTHTECITLSFCLFVMAALSSSYLMEFGSIILISGILISIIMVFLLAPSESANKPLSRKKYARNKKISRILVIMMSAAAVFLYLNKEITGYIYITAVVALFFESISLLKN